MELQKNEKGFYYFTLIAGPHDHIRTKVWVNRAFLNFIPCPHRGTFSNPSPEWIRGMSEKDRSCYRCGAEFEVGGGRVTHPYRGEVPEDLVFPLKGAQVVTSEKGAFVLCPSKEGWVALVRESSGYRGTAAISFEGDYKVVVSGEEYHSPRGNLGETAWAVVNVNGLSLTVHARITGRKVDQGAYSYRVFPDGRTENLEEDGLEALL